MVCQKHLELKNKFNSAYLIHLGLQSSTNFTETLEVIWFFLMISHNILKLLSKVHSLLGFHVTSFFCKHVSLKSQWNYLTRTERGANTAVQDCARVELFLLLPVPSPSPARIHCSTDDRSACDWSCFCKVAHHQDRVSSYPFISTLSWFISSTSLTFFRKEVI